MYDLIIVGGSVAGASAGVYAARRMLNFAVITKDLSGEVALCGDVENWIGDQHTTGIELAQRFAEHLKSYKPTIIEGATVTKIEKTANGFIVTADEKQYESKAVIVSSGAHSRELGVPGEKEYRLKGVSYCTVCDGPLFKGKRTITIGGGNGALESALMLSDIAEHVTIINKNPKFKGEAMLLDKLKAKSNVDIVYEGMTTEITGDGSFANGLNYKTADGETHHFDAEGIFVHIGQTPNTQMLPPECEKNEFGYVVVTTEGSTNVPGLFTAGDMTAVPHKQIIIAAGQGAAAALSAVQYLNRLQ
jgi:alkyl hydroperoxide reductase subunit AhpF